MTDKQKDSKIGRYMQPDKQSQKKDKNTSRQTNKPNTRTKCTVTYLSFRKGLKLQNRTNSVYSTVDKSVCVIFCHSIATLLLC